MAEKMTQVISPELLKMIKQETINARTSVLLKKGDTVLPYFYTLIENINSEILPNVRLEDLPNTRIPMEFEVRFASRNKTSISKIKFDNVIKYLKSFNFIQMINSFENSMRIIPETRDDEKIRIELNGLIPIQHYCRSENLENVMQMNKDMVQFTEKKNYSHNGEHSRPIYNELYDLKYSFMTEKSLDFNDKVVRDIRSNWKKLSKVYRIINRLKFSDGSEKYPLFNVDMSVVKQNKSSRDGRSMLNSGVVDAFPVYEIECELNVDNFKKQLFEFYLTLTTEDKTLEIFVNKINTFINDVYNTLKKYVKLILMGLQDSKHLLSLDEIEKNLVEYSDLVFGRRQYPLYPKNFCGPSSLTLQPENIQPLENPEKLEEEHEEGELDEVLPSMKTISYELPNIRGHYCVTDKADGMRKLLYVNGVGKFFLINTNMEIQYTGCELRENKELFNSVLDGEHVVHDKSGKYVNVFMAFDIYFINKRNVRHYPFTVLGSGGTIEDEQRLRFLNKFVRDTESTWKNSHTERMPLTLKNKQFYIAKDDFSIFECCFKILDSVNNSEYEYETDGLIFTPTLLPVGSSSMKKHGPVSKTTWVNSFKWKPPKYNTIDFLVTTEKTTNGTDKIENVMYGGTRGPSGNDLKQYKTLILRCGYDEKKHGVLNACMKVYNGDYIQPFINMDEDDGYLPVPFFPTNPYDENAHLCRIELKSDTIGNKAMLTHEGETFEDEMIVEFSYNPSAPLLEKWTPLRVRYDKTQEFRMGYKNFGNAYHVANSNWQSIHNPISDKGISTGENLPKPINDDVYYSAKKKSDLTKSMRTFHNIVVKQELLRVAGMLSIPTLLDLAVGKSGDLNKWTTNNYDMVVGVDISKDNINNPRDGACLRYLRKHQNNSNNNSIPDALFFQANSSLNLKNGDAFYTDKERDYMQILYGIKEPSNETPNKIKQYAGQFREGFGVTACMFALHYFFKDVETLKSFIINVVENTTKDGIFIGCCFDGKKIFDLLDEKEKDESFTIQHKGELITRITKLYNTNTFDSNSLSLGMAIDVYQESIGTTAREYLVNFDYFIKVMSLFGFEVLSEDTVKNIISNGLKTSLGSFRHFKTIMESQNIKMEEYEEKLSYLNNYFIFVKRVNVDPKTVGSIDDMGMIDTFIAQREAKMERVLNLKMSASRTDVADENPTTPVPVKKVIKMKLKKK